jgi:hypothetical protein
MEQKRDLHHKREPQNLASLNWIKANRKSPLHKLNKFEKIMIAAYFDERNVSVETDCL